MAFTAMADATAAPRDMAISASAEEITGAAATVSIDDTTGSRSAEPTTKMASSWRSLRSRAITLAANSTSVGQVLRLGGHSVGVHHRDQRVAGLEDADGDIFVSGDVGDTARQRLGGLYLRDGDGVLHAPLLQRLDDRARDRLPGGSPRHADGVHAVLDDRLVGVQQHREQGFSVEFHTVDDVERTAVDGIAVARHAFDEHPPDGRRGDRQTEHQVHSLSPSAFHPGQTLPPWPVRWTFAELAAGPQPAIH